MDRFFSDQIGPLPAVVLIGLAVVCCVTDLWKEKIYNAVTYPTAALGLAIQVALHGVGGLGLAAGGFAVGFFPAFLMFALGGLEGGDVKLLGVIGILAGPVPTTEVMLVAFLVGGFLALVKLAWKGQLFSSLGRVLRYLAGMLVPGVERVALAVDRQNTMRFGFSISVAVLLVLWSLKMGGVLSALVGPA